MIETVVHENLRFAASRELEKEERLVWLGAGFSAAATRGDAPVTSRFFDRVDDPQYPLLREALRECLGHPERADIEELLIFFQHSSSLCGESIQSRYTQLQQQQVRQELNDYVIDRLANLPVDGVHWSVDLAQSFADRATVISTNYDNLPERILCNAPGVVHQYQAVRNNQQATCPHCKLKELLKFQCSCVPGQAGTPDWHGAIIKPHGSITWGCCCTPGCYAQDCIVPDEHCRPTKGAICSCCGQMCDPCLVLPTPSKNYCEFPALVERMWLSAKEALQAARQLVVFGFSFPKSDALINQVVRQCLGESGTLEHVVVIDLHPQGVLDRLQSLLSSAKGVEYSTYTVELGQDVPASFEDLLRCIYGPQLKVAEE